MQTTNPPVPKVSLTHRVVEIQQETSEIVQLLTTTVLQLNASRDVWHDILNIAKQSLEDTVREAATTTSLEYGLASPYFQQKVMELNIRIEILEEMCNSLPLVDLEEQDNH